MSKQKISKLLGFIIAVVVFSSCGSPKYLTGPTLYYPGIKNTCSFGIQNMDSKGKTENSALTCHYDGFDVEYVVQSDFLVNFVIINNSNKSLLIDKSKSYVLYNGYSTQLFKDVRSSKSTTFNNVQDAINNVQTNESSVLMTIPPYSKWALPIEETNLRQIKELPDFKYDPGLYALSPYDNKEIVEFVIPYSYDYSMAKWDTSRNRVYVSSINSVAFKSETRIISSDPVLTSTYQYYFVRSNGLPENFAEANRIDLLNMRKYRNHSRWKSFLNYLAMPLTCCLSVFQAVYLPYYGCKHVPPTYGVINPKIGSGGYTLKETEQRLIEINKVSGY